LDQSSLALEAVADDAGLLKALLALALASLAALSFSTHASAAAARALVGPFVSGDLAAIAEAASVAVADPAEFAADAEACASVTPAAVYAAATTGAAAAGVASTFVSSFFSFVTAGTDTATSFLSLKSLMLLWCIFQVRLRFQGTSISLER